jgi:hypothetical protein
MPKVPTYDGLQVGADTLNPVQIQPFQDSGEAGKDAQMIGKGMLQAGTGITKMMLRQKKLDDQAAYDKANATLNEWEFGWQKENQDRKLEKANGMTNDFFTQHAEKVEELAQTLPQEVQDKFRFKMRDQGISQAKRWSIYEAGQKHEFRLSANQASLTTYTNKAINADDQGSDFVDAMSELRDLLDQRLDLQGVTDQKVKDAAWRATQADVYVGRTRALLDKDPVQALGYWKGVRQFVEDSKLRQDYDEKLKVSAEQNEAETWVESEFDNINGRGTLAQRITDKYEGKQEDVAMATFQRLMAADATSKAIVKDQNSKAAWKMVRTPDNIKRSLNAIPKTQQLWLQENAPDVWNGLLDWQAFKDVETNPEVFLKLSELKDTQPAEFKKIGLDQYRGQLSNSDLESLSKAQNTIDKDMQTQSRDKQIKNVYQEMGWTSKDLSKQAEFRKAYDAAEEEFQKGHGGKPPNQQERQQIIDRLLLDGEVDGWLWNSDKKLYQVIGTEDAGKFSFTVPDVDREEIKRALIKSGQTPNEVNIQRMYRTKLGFDTPSEGAK